MFGEIDCREGLTGACEKLKYADLEAAMRELCGIYLSQLRRLIRERGFEVFVHPTAPVLNETRSTVRLFEQVRVLVLFMDRFSWVPCGVLGLWL